MRIALFYTVLLSTLALPVMAQDEIGGGSTPLPEPNVISLVGIGAVAYVIIRRLKK